MPEKKLSIDVPSINVTEQTVVMPLSRYEELIKKEVIYDEIMKNKDVSVYLYERVMEVLK